MGKITKIGLSKILLVFISCCFTVTSHAQITIDIGYTGSTFLKNQMHSIISTFNDALPEGAKKMDRMNYMNGLHIGIGTYGKAINISGEYNGTFMSTAAKKLRNAQSDSYNYILNYSVNSAGLSLGVPFANICEIGTTVMYQFASMKNLTTFDSKRTELANIQGFSLKPWLDIRISDPSDRIGASLRLFVNYPLYNMDITEVHRALDPQNQSQKSPDDLQWKMTSAGISFILHNRR